MSARARDAATNQTTATAVSVTVNNTSIGLVAAYGFNEGAGTMLADQPDGSYRDRRGGDVDDARDVWEARLRLTESTTG